MSSRTIWATRVRLSQKRTVTQFFSYEILSFHSLKELLTSKLSVNVLLYLIETLQVIYVLN